MKTISKRNPLRLEKFQIAKLNNLENINGGAANVVEIEENEIQPSTFACSTDTSSFEVCL